jgi:hypothetical protein
VPVCPQPPTILLLPPPNLEPIEVETLSERQVVDTWLADVERYWILRQRYEALQAWGGKCWGASDRKDDDRRPAFALSLGGPSR